MFDEHQDAIRTMLRRGYLTNIDDTGQQQLVDVTGFVGDSPSQIVRSQHFGLSSNPPSGAEGLILSKGGRSGNAWMLGLEHPDYRPTNTPSGGTALYDSSGNIIKLIGASAVFTFTNAGWQVTCKGATITSQGGDIVIDPGGNTIKLGGAGASAKVMTENGPSSKVLAVV